MEEPSLLPSVEEEDIELSLTLGTTTEGSEDDLETKDDEFPSSFENEEDQDEMENRDRRDLLRGSRQQRTSKNELCIKLNGRSKCSKKGPNVPPESQVVRTYRSFVHPYQHTGKVKKKSAENKEWKSFKNKEELFNYIENIVLKPNLPPDEDAVTKPGKKTKKVKPINTSNMKPTEKDVPATKPIKKDVPEINPIERDKPTKISIEKYFPTNKPKERDQTLITIENLDSTDPMDMKSSWINFQKWMQNQLNHPQSQLVSDYEVFKNPNRSDSIRTMGEVPSKDKRQDYIESVTTDLTIVETPFVFLDNSPEKRKRYDELTPLQGEVYIEKTKETSRKNLGKGAVEVSAKAYATGTDKSSNHQPTFKPIFNLHFEPPYLINDNLQLESTEKNLKALEKLSSSLVQDAKPTLMPDHEKDKTAKSQPVSKVTLSGVNKHDILLSNAGGNLSENDNQVSKEKIFEYKFKASSVEDTVMIPDPNNYGSIFFNTSFNHQNATKHSNVVNTTSVIDKNVTTTSIPPNFPKSGEVLLPTEKYPNTADLNNTKSANSLNMVIKFPENALKEMEASMKSKKKLIMNVDFEHPDITPIEEEVGAEENITRDIEADQDETSNNTFMGKDGIQMLKFVIKITRKLQESVNNRKDLNETEKILLYNIILQKFMNLLTLDIELMSKNE